MKMDKIEFKARRVDQGALLSYNGSIYKGKVLYTYKTEIDKGHDLMLNDISHFLLNGDIGERERIGYKQ